MSRIYRIGIDYLNDAVIVERQYSTGDYRLAHCVFATNEDGSIDQEGHKIITVLEELCYTRGDKSSLRDALRELIGKDQMIFEDAVVQRGSFINPDCLTYAVPFGI